MNIHYALSIQTRSAQHVGVLVSNDARGRCHNKLKQMYLSPFLLMGAFFICYQITHLLAFVLLQELANSWYHSSCASYSYPVCFVVT